MSVRLNELVSRFRQLPSRWRAWLAGAFVFLVLLLVFPFKITTVPRWRLRVVDEIGIPVRGVTVTEHWQHYLVEHEGSEETQVTDEGGRVDFTERTVRAGMLSRLLGGAATFLGQGLNGKYGPYGSVVVWGTPKYETAVGVYNPETLPPAELVVHHIP